MRSIGFGAAGLACLLAGCATTEEAPPPAGVPYACADGRPARVIYEGGGYFPRATARVLFDGRVIPMAAVPPTQGLRYVSDEGGENAPILIWSLRGEEGLLSELAPGAEEEREIARCMRLRSGGESAHAEPPHEGEAGHD